MNAYTVCFSGFSREDEAKVLSSFDQANARLPKRWTVTNEKEAELIVIDMDTVYGHMTWLKANNAGKMTVGITNSERSETDHVLPRPVSQDNLASLLAQLSAQTASAAPIARTTGQQPAMTAEMLNPRNTSQQAAVVIPEAHNPRSTGQQAAIPSETNGVGPRTTTGTMAAMAAMGPRALKLLDFLKPGILGGPVKIQLNDAPLLVIDPANQTYLGSNALKPYLAYGSATLTEADFIAIDDSEFHQLSKQLGGAQPLARLAWLSALVGGNGQLLPAYNPNSLFKLNKWPQTEREFPKHFRIATVMMKGPAKLTDIAEQSGAALHEVTDFVNANLISGHASV